MGSSIETNITEQSNADWVGLAADAERTGSNLVILVEAGNPMLFDLTFLQALLG